MKLNEIKKVLLSQNRFKFFTSENNNIYLYDALSQNIYPVTKDLMDFFTLNELIKIDEGQFVKLYEKLSKWNGTQNYSRLPETHLTINFSNKCNLNCNYCYRNKNDNTSMSIDKAFEVLEYVNKYYKMNNDEIIFSLDMTAEALMDYEKIIQFDDKLAEYENLYIEKSDIVSISIEDFFNKLITDLIPLKSKQFTGDILNDLNLILLDTHLYSYFPNQEKVKRILLKGNFDSNFLDKKRLLRLNRELLETFYSNYLKHKDYQQFRIWFMSNGAHITNKNIELIKKIRINPFWISLDGPKEIHNKNRKYYDNRGSYDDVVNNIKLLQKNNIDVKISCVITKDYPYPDKLYLFFKNLNISAIQMCPIRNGNDLSFDENNIVELKESYKRLYDLIFEEIKNKDYSSFTLLKEDLSLVAIMDLIQRIRITGRCTWGDEVIIDSNGNMYPCLYVMGHKEYLLGNINENKNSKEILKPLLVEQMENCQTCWARYLCGGTCHYNSIINNQSIYKPDFVECQIRKFIITESIMFLIRLKENNVNLNNILKINN